MGGSLLPGALPLGGEGEFLFPAATFENEIAVITGGVQVEAAAITEVVPEEAEDFANEAKAEPLAVAAVAGLPGGELIEGQVVPGVGGAELGEDAIQDEAVVEEGTAGGGGGGWRKEGFYKEPLFVG